VGRMHSPGKGIARSARPYRRAPPTWSKMSAEEVKLEIVKNAKKGLTPSQIGVLLRDSQGVPQVQSITGQKILRILRAEKIAPELPEDLYHLIKKAVNIRKHLDRNRKDTDSKFRLILKLDLISKAGLTFFSNTTNITTVSHINITTYSPISTPRIPNGPSINTINNIPTSYLYTMI